MAAGLGSRRVGADDTWVERPIHPISLRQLFFFGRVLTEERLLSSANYVRTELPTRLAHRLRDMQRLPYVVVTNPHLSIVYELYYKSFETFRRVPVIRGVEENARYCKIISESLVEHLAVIPNLIMGVLQCQKFVEPDVMDQFVQAMLRARISRRVIAEQHLALTETFNSPWHVAQQSSENDFVGEVLLRCNAKEVIQRCGKVAQDLCRAPDGSGTVVPEIKVQGHTSATFPYVLTHLEYIIGELLRNSMQAVMEKHKDTTRPPPPIEVLVCEAPHQVIIRFSDQGGGIPRDIRPFLWSFNKGPRSLARLESLGQVPGLAATTQEVQHPMIDDQTKGRESSLSTLASRPPGLRLGMGLPMSKVYAEYWAGGLELHSLEGYGVDAFLQISKLGNQNEQLTSRASIDAFDMLQFDRMQFDMMQLDQPAGYTANTKLSVSTRDQDAKEGSKVDSPRPFSGRRFGDSSTKSNPFSALSPPTSKSSNANASSAFGLGSGAFASFSATKTPKTPGSGPAFDFPKEKKEKEAEGGPDKAEAPASSDSSSARPDSATGQHELRYSWNLYYRPPANKFSDYEKSISKVAGISTVETFWAVYAHLKRPSALPTVSDYHIFKDGIRPVWEDEANKRGGKWIVRLKKGVADRYWEDLLMAIIGDQFLEAADEVCGAVLSVRSGEDVLSVWTKIDGGRNIKIRETIKRILAFPPDTNIVWKSHDDSIAQRSALDEARHQKASATPGQPGIEKRRSTLHDDSERGKPKTTTSFQTKSLSKASAALLKSLPLTAFVIPDPLEEDKQKARRPYMTLQPTNTLSDPRPPSRLPYPAQRISKSTPRARNSPHPASADVRDNNHSAPNKKQRTGPSPKDGIQDSPVDVNFDVSAHDIDHHSGKRTSRLLRRGSNLEPVESTPAEHKSQPIVILDSQSQNNSLRADWNHIRHALNDSQIPAPQTTRDAEGDAVKAVHSAGLEGLIEHQSSPPPTPPPNVSPTCATVLNAHDPPDQASIERGGLPLDESPDPLQKPTTTQQSRKKQSQIPISQRLATMSRETHRSKATNKRLSNEPGRKTDATSSRTLDQPNISAFAIKDIAGFYVPRKQDYYLLYIDHIEKNFWISISNPTIDTDPVNRCRPLRQIIQIFHGAESSKLLVKLSLSHDELANDFVVELESHKKVWELLKAIMTISPVRIIPWEDSRLDRVFDKKIKLAQDSKQAGGAIHNISEDHSPPRNQVDSAHSASKKSSKLDSGDQTDDCDQQEPKMSRDTGNLSSICTTPSRNLQTELEDTDAGDHPRKKRKATTGLVSEYFVPRSTRSTRSTTQPEPQSIRTPSPGVPFSKCFGLGPQWSKPLAYPRESRKREIVEYSDLLRLDEDQFLNDSLISFFIRYLQHQLELSNPDLLKKMHFFNTYFFDTLTKNSKGRKDVNHAGVARWTKNIDIFSRDFVVVPVNDNLHWYLAIICNLSAFTKRRRHSGDDEEDDSADGAATSIEILEDLQLPENSQDRDSGHLQSIQQTRQSFQELTLQDPRDVMPSASPEAKGSSQTGARTPPGKAKAGRGKKSKIRKSLPKYDPETPIIITLDSLGQARGSAVSALKQYVVLEAKDKKALDIDRDDLKGMTAKGIPSQSNYSDCGLYMCMYLEQFVADAYGFVKKILQREDANLRWPLKIRSDELRSRLRQLILELHRQQEGHTSEGDIPPLGSIMVELRNPSPDFIASTPAIQSDEFAKASSEAAPEAARKYRDASQQRLEFGDTESPTMQPQLDEHGDRVTKQDMRPTSSSSQKRAISEVDQARRLVDRIPSNVHSPIVVDDSPERPPKQLRPLPELALLKRPFKMQNRLHLRWDDNDDPIVDERHSNSPDRAQKTSHHKPSDPARRRLRSSHSSKDLRTNDRSSLREAELSGTKNFVDESPGHVNHQQDGVVADSADVLDVDVTEIQEELSAGRTSKPEQSQHSERVQKESSEDFEELV
ncbi:hypothetical protein DV737_g1262, partial [Chaetothyriales sp. CBS 132003]